MNQRKLSFAVVSMLAFTPACELPGADLGIGQGRYESGNDCDETGCGHNTPLMGNSTLVWFTTDGTPNDEGWRLMEFFAPSGGAPPFQVKNGELQILNSLGTVSLDGADVVGSVFQFADGNNAIRYVRVAAYHDVVPYWVGPAETLHSYLLEWSEPGGAWQQLCSAPPADGYSGAELDVFLYTHERYDFDANAIVASGPALAGNINLACMSSVHSKMLRYRHRPETPLFNAFHTTPAQRQTLMRMFRADYCGDGERFTWVGMPLEWRDGHAPPWIAEGPTVAHEALWTKSGALCLDTPRGGMAYVEAQLDCPLPPPCGGLVLHEGVWVDTSSLSATNGAAYMETWLPPPPP